VSIYHLRFCFLASYAAVHGGYGQHNGNRQDDPLASSLIGYNGSAVAMDH
jgi:hypothetical protein